MLRLLQVNERGHNPYEKKRAFILTNQTRLLAFIWIIIENMADPWTASKCHENNSHSARWAVSQSSHWWMDRWTLNKYSQMFSRMCALPSLTLRQRIIHDCLRKLRVRFLRKSKIGFLNPRESEKGFCISRLRVRHRNGRIHSGSGFFSSYGSPWSERAWIDLLSKETQNPFSDSFGLKNPTLDFLSKNAP